MKILAIGDFHGIFPDKIKTIIKKEKIDLVVSIGDYPSFTLKKEFFKYVYGKKPEVNLWDFIGKKKYKKAVTKDFKRAEKVISKLNKLTVPIISVLGNHDFTFANDVFDVRKPTGNNFWKWDWERNWFVKKAILKNKNIHLINYSVFEIHGFVFIGGRGHSSRGRVKSRAFKKHKKILDNLFERFKKENKEGKVIFVYHNSPYNTKLDKINAKDAHKLAKGKHFGSKMSRRIIDKFQPILSLSGHIDEGRGKQKLGKTLAVNVGSAHRGWGSIIEIDNKVIATKFVKFR